MKTGNKFWLAVFSAVVFLGSLFFSEFIIRSASLVFPKIGMMLSKEPRLIPDEKLGVRLNPRHPDHDKDGFRNRVVPPEAPVVAMGDSQTYGYAIPREKAWPQQLERMAKVTTYNMASGGWGPVQYLMLLDGAWKLNPKLIIVAFYPGNDLFDSFSQVYVTKQMPVLKNPAGNVVKTVLVAEREEPLNEKNLRFLNREDGTRKPGAEARAQETRPPAETLPPRKSWLRNIIAENSKIYLMFKSMKSYLRYTANRSIWKYAKEDAWEKGYTQILEAGKIRTILTPGYRLSVMDLDDPRVREGLRISLEAIRMMRDSAKGKGSDLWVLLLPTKELVFEDIAAGNPVGRSNNFVNLIRNEKKIWSETRKYFQDRNIAYVDPLPLLKNYLQTGKQPYWISSDGHPNPLGQKALAESVLSEMKSKNCPWAGINKQPAR